MCIRDRTRAHALVESAYRGDSARKGWTHEADMLGGVRTDREALVEILSDPLQCLLLAFDDEALIGTVNIADVGAGRAYLGLLSVDPARQASGLGRRLLEVAEQEAKARFGAAALEMTVIRQRPELIAYYERRGYRVTGEARPFPYGDERFGLPQRPDLIFEVLEKEL